MSTVIHTPHESDTALSLYENDLNSAYYSTYGCYGRPDFLELAKRLGIVETRAIRIIDDFLLKRNQMETFVSKSFLSGAAKDKYVHYVYDKLRKMGGF
jgi:serine/threonine-protein kinase HipA